MKPDQLFEENVPSFAAALAARGIDPTLALDVAKVCTKSERNLTEQSVIDSAWALLKFPPNEATHGQTN